MKILSIFALAFLFGSTAQADELQKLLKYFNNGISIQHSEIEYEQKFDLPKNLGKCKILDSDDAQTIIVSEFSELLANDENQNHLRISVVQASSDLSDIVLKQDVIVCKSSKRGREYDSITKIYRGTQGFQLKSVFRIEK